MAAGSDEILWAWAHLSDIHMGHGNAQHRANQDLVMEGLKEDLQRALTEAELPALDALLVTGDIGFSGDTRELEKGKAPLEYQRAREWLEAAAEQLKLKRGQVFVVPGNHDVQRPVDKDDDVRRFRDALRSGKEPLDEALANNIARSRLANRLANYLIFAEGFAPTCFAEPIAPKTERLWWKHTINGPRGLTIRLVGLNSALLAADGKDKGKLRLGETQLRETLSNRNEREITIVLTHHPFTGGWLADQQSADDWVRSRANIHLCGHVHDPESHGLRRGGAQHGLVRIVAGAAHEKRRPKGELPRHGYNLAAIVRQADGYLQLRVWSRRWSEKNKSFRLELEDSKPGAVFAVHELGMCLVDDEAVPSSGPADSADSGDLSSSPAALGDLRAAYDRALAAREPAGLAAVLALVLGWLKAADEMNARHARWLDVQDMFARLDLSIWKNERKGIEVVAVALVDVDFYRQTDLSTEARLALLTQVRGMLPVTEHLACTRVDLERAELAALGRTGEDVAWALTLCDDALAAAQQLVRDVGPVLWANALLTRAQILGSQHRFEEAITEAKRAAVVYEEHQAIHSLSNVNRLLGEIWTTRGHTANGRLFLDYAIDGYKRERDSISEAQALSVRAMCWPARKLDRALSDCDDAVRLYDAGRLRTLQGEAMLTRARINERASRFIEATKDYEDAARYLEASPERYYYTIALLALASSLGRNGRRDHEMNNCVERAENAVKEIQNKRLAAVAALRICKLLTELPVPDKPGIRRNATMAREWADACNDLDLEAEARRFVNYAGP